MRRSIIWRTGMMALGCGVSIPALAQSVPASPTPATPPAAAAQPAANPGQANGQQVYPIAYFAQFAPSTALQIVQRVPGFTLDIGNASVRGFSGAAGNVVINGQRPSSKTDTIDTILARIPANRVLRVEVGPGELYGSDYSSKPQVLNLVLTTAGGMAGTIEAGLRRDYTGKILPEGSASVLIRSGPSTFNAALKFDNEATTEEGPDTVVTLPAGIATEFRRKVNRINDPNGAISLSWDYNGGANRTAHLNTRIARDWFSLTQTNHVMPVGGTVRDDLLTQRYRTDNYELGGDVTRPFAGGGIKLIGLATRRDRRLGDASYNRVAGTTIGGFTQTLGDRLDETLVRLVWNRVNWNGWNVETGVEGVINRLDSKVDLFGLNGAGGATRIDLPIDRAVVREVRGEAFINAGRGITRKLRVDLGLTYEASRLTVTGDATAARTLTFIKPKATFDWKISTKWHGQLSIQRTVAQLQFEDFIGSAELTNDRVNGGNADLLPQRAWEVLATIERPILGDGLIKLELGYNKVSLVQDRVPTPDGFDAPGNLGDGQVFSVRPRIELPLGKFGIKGGRFTLTGSYVSTSVRDPYTLQQRPFSGSSAFFGTAEFRQDLKRFAWGVTAEVGTPFTIYRLDELDRLARFAPQVSAFGEWRPDAKTTLAFNVYNLTDVGAIRTRTFFAPDRHTPNPFLRETRERNSHAIMSLTFKHSFG